jgi:uncharacterized membrane protein
MKGKKMYKEATPQSSRRQAFFKEWRTIVPEIGKWLLVVWLLWPLGRPVPGKFTVLRIVLGVCLFVIFAGKVLYDVIIMDYVRQKRTSVKRDIFTLVAMVAIIALLVGLVLVLFGLFIAKWSASANPPSG